jgi:hypothetical protein
MKTFPWDILVLAAVLAVNRLAVPGSLFKPGLFWAIQAMNIGLAAYVALVGLPGVAGFPSVGWIVAALLTFHTFQNLTVRSAALHKRDREAAERDRVAKLRALGEPDARPAGPSARTTPPEEA